MRGMLSEIKNAGLNAVELAYRLGRDDLEKIAPLLKEFGLKVSSLHNFCPRPDDGHSERHPSNYYRLSSLDEAERLKAVEWTQKTIDTAVHFGAEVVVVHAGTVELDNDPTRQLLDMYRENRQDSEEFDALRKTLVEARRSRKDPYINAVVRSFKEVMPYAQSKNVKVGLETRYYPIEIPNHEEIGYLLGIFSKQGMYYWHDVGHAEANSRIGITPHERYLNDYAGHLIGWHLHGVKVLRDHLAPFEGDFDISLPLRFMQPYHIKVIESHASASLDQIRLAVSKLQ